MNLERSEKTVFYASVERSIFKNNRLDGLCHIKNLSAAALSLRARDTESADSLRLCQKETADLESESHTKSQRRLEKLVSNGYILIWGDGYL